MELFSIIDNSMVRIKFNHWRTTKDFVEDKFDISQGYHHIGITNIT